MVLFLKVDGQPQQESLGETPMKMKTTPKMEMVAIDIIKKPMTMKMMTTKGMTDLKHSEKMTTTLMTNKK